MNRLKELRKLNKMLQSDVADYMGITQSGYSYWENGKNAIDDESLKKLASLYGVTIDYLLGIDTKKEPAPDIKIESELMDPLDAQLMDLLPELTEDDKKMLLALIQTRLGQK